MEFWRIIFLLTNGNALMVQGQFPNFFYNNHFFLADIHIDNWLSLSTDGLPIKSPHQFIKVKDTFNSHFSSTSHFLLVFFLFFYILWIFNEIFFQIINFYYLSLKWHLSKWNTKWWRRSYQQMKNNDLSFIAGQCIEYQHIDVMKEKNVKVANW